MKTHHFLKMVGATVLGASLLLCSCARRDQDHGTKASSGLSPVAKVGAAVSGTWQQIKDCSFAQRDQFEAKLNELSDKLGQRADDAKGEASTKLAEARANLRAAMAGIGHSSADTWQATKQKVQAAMDKAEAAYKDTTK